MKEFLICIDSDGCAFDSMEIKHKECFCPVFIEEFGLQAVSKYARDAWEFVNLYSDTRGVHRLRALLRAVTLLSEREEVKRRGFVPPLLPHLRAYVEKGEHLSNEGLEAYMSLHPETREEFSMILRWSKKVNERIGEMVHGVPPFPFVRENLAELGALADIVIVSATPQEALEREWAEHDLTKLVTEIRGQEKGTKKEIIESLKDQYPEGHVMMIGDAPGDREAARSTSVLYYPICPDEEESSWENFKENATAFLNGTYKGEREDALIRYFETLLPTEPQWKRG